jgi:hypothetical protein
MDGCITVMPKLLIWSENTYKQKKKNQNEREMVGMGSRKGKGRGGEIKSDQSVFSESCVYFTT